MKLASVVSLAFLEALISPMPWSRNHALKTIGSLTYSVDTGIREDNSEILSQFQSI